MSIGTVSTNIRFILNRAVYGFLFLRRLAPCIDGFLNRFLNLYL